MNMKMKMKLGRWFIRLWREDEGLGTLEIILIVSVLVAVALIFRDTLMGWVEDLLERINPVHNE